jgi:ABC-type Fe3+/spermidine/putrescine transport system ATPase subunit
VFVADFLGVSNLMDAAGEGGGIVRVGDFRLRAGCGEVAARGPVKVVARPERLALLPHGVRDDNCVPGMVERTVYVGANLQVITRLATGETVQVSIANTGEAEAYAQGTPVAVHMPSDALRVLAPGPVLATRGELSPELEPAPAVAS